MTGPEPPEAPPGTLLQSLLVDDDGEVAGYRIDGDGRYWSRRRGEDWTEGPRLTVEEVARAARAIDESGVDALEARYEEPVGEEAPSTLWVQAARPGGLRTVAVVGGRRGPALERLTAALTDIFRKRAAPPPA